MVQHTTIKEAIILAGGKGTRLQDVIGAVPKCLAPVAGKAFLYHLINYLRMQGIEKFIFSLGYQHQQVVDWLQSEFRKLDYQCVIEEDPLDTGGAIREALEIAKDSILLVTNGDTIFKSDVQALGQFHLEKKADCTLSLRRVEDASRYGTVEKNSDGRITAFKEKKGGLNELINSGLYILNKTIFDGMSLPRAFSFEKAFLQSKINNARIFGLEQYGYFVDIGIPADFKQASEDLKLRDLDLKAVDKTWTLFLDRDGVINYEKENDYILNWEEFKFYEDAGDALQVFSQKFGKIFIVSNQRGIGRGRMTEQDLLRIHNEMRKEIISKGGRIDGIYFCTAIHDQAFCRKPNPGMARQAKLDHPEIDFSRALMVGNKISDIQFGRAAGMHTVYLATTHPEQEYPHPDIDLRFNSLSELANAL